MLFLILIIAISLVRPSKSEAKSFGDILTGGDIFLRVQVMRIFLMKQIKKMLQMIHIIYCLEFGIIIAIAIGLILGIQFVTTGVEGQAKIKEKIQPYIIGCIVVFGGFGIWRAVIILSSDTLDNGEVL